MYRERPVFTLLTLIRKAKREKKNMMHLWPEKPLHNTQSSQRSGTNLAIRQCHTLKLHLLWIPLWCQGFVRPQMSVAVMKPGFVPGDHTMWCGHCHLRPPPPTHIHTLTPPLPLPPISSHLQSHIQTLPVGDFTSLYHTDTFFLSSLFLS